LEPPTNLVARRRAGSGTPPAHRLAFADLLATHPTAKSALHLSGDRACVRTGGRAKLELGPPCARPCGANCPRRRRARSAVAVGVEILSGIRSRSAGVASWQDIGAGGGWGEGRGPPGRRPGTATHMTEAPRSKHGEKFNHGVDNPGCAATNRRDQSSSWVLSRRYRR